MIATTVSLLLQWQRGSLVAPAGPLTCNEPPMACAPCFRPIRDQQRRRSSISRRRFRAKREREDHEHFVVVFASNPKRPTLEPEFLESGRAVKPTSRGI